MNIINKIDNFILKQKKVYLGPGEEPPKGTNVRRGPKGGKYYETNKVSSKETKASAELAAFDALSDKYEKLKLELERAHNRGFAGVDSPEIANKNATRIQNKMDNIGIEQIKLTNPKYQERRPYRKIKSSESGEKMKARPSELIEWEQQYRKIHPFSYGPYGGVTGQNMSRKTSYQKWAARFLPKYKKAKEAFARGEPLPEIT